MCRHSLAALAAAARRRCPHSVGGRVVLCGDGGHKPLCAIIGGADVVGGCAVADTAGAVASWRLTDAGPVDRRLAGAPQIVVGTAEMVAAEEAAVG